MLGESWKREKKRRLKIFSKAQKEDQLGSDECFLGFMVQKKCQYTIRIIKLTPETPQTPRTNSLSICVGLETVKNSAPNLI